MPDDVSQVSGTSAEGTAKNKADSPEKPEDSPLGVYSGFPYSPEPFAELSESARLSLMALDDLCTKADVAARRMEVEQALTYRGLKNPL